ncbi:MAG: type II toxin-antitoxin system VapC family toxin [Verrucomicrobiota bacterium]
MILLDTSVAILLLRGEASPASLATEPVGISTIVEMELQLGVLHGGGEREAARVAEFLKESRIFDFDRTASQKAGQVLAQLWKAGKPIGDFDAQIAGHAMALNLPLLTDNMKNFERVVGLQMLAWR